MNFDETKQMINQMIDENYKGFIKALVSVEKGINDNQALDVIYEDFMEVIMEVCYMRTLII